MPKIKTKSGVRYFPYTKSGIEEAEKAKKIGKKGHNKSIKRYS